MTVSAREFDAWLDRAGLPTSSTEIGNRLSMRRSTIKTQRVRNRVSEEVVVALARSFNINPLGALSEFELYLGLQNTQPPPTRAELLSQVTHTDLFAELLSRNRTDMAHLIGAHYEMSPIPHPDGVRAWIDAIDPGSIRTEMSHQSGIATTNLSTMLSDNRLAPELALLASAIAGVSQISGLVVTGLLTTAEANWPSMGRENALRDLDDLDVIDLADQRLKSLRRRVKKKLDARENAHALWETLG
ncbi:hypothetical protein IWX63_003156 [Arthrobacter sp. CAN_A2]|uniref:hypothetical protein n=1 Tax=Arthrobacter sp. CAN_A2 TaxID=2787718 RepID=UPI0018EF6E93